MTKPAKQFGKDQREFFKLISTEEHMGELKKILRGDSPHLHPARTLRRYHRRQGAGLSVRHVSTRPAAWISPALHLKAIRAYDQFQTDGVAVAEHAADDFLDNPLDYMEKLLGQAKKLKAGGIVRPRNAFMAL